MRHLQPDLKSSNRIERDCFLPMLIVLYYGGGIHGRPNFPVSKREIRNRQTRVLVPHARAKDELDDDQNRGPKQQKSQFARMKVSGHAFPRINTLLSSGFNLPIRPSSL